ncbi:MAG: hypothetical protein RL748_1016 [Pseudomonadota bacterium]|jgi:hypothetical protein
MKNFSTVGLVIALSATLPAMAQPANSRCAFKPNAPDSHLVVRGDTLWGISGKFLEHAWCWPEVWGLNKEEIKNPHWIYPGQTVYFDRVSGRLRLGKPLNGSGNGNAGLNNTDLSLKPQIRSQDLGKDAITAIPSGDIEPFLSQPLIIESEELKNAPSIVAVQEGRVSVGEGDKAYVRGDLKEGTSFQVFRPGVPLKDPDNGKIIGYEAFFLGTVKLSQLAKPGIDLHTFVVASFKQEITAGDRLMPAPPTPLLNYVPHPPVKDVKARVMSIYGGVTHAGQNQIVSINRGSLDGLDLGAVLELSRYGISVKDRTAQKKWYQFNTPTVRLPDEEYGSLFIFRTFKHVSYGLVMQVKDSVQVGDLATSPQ